MTKPRMKIGASALCAVVVACLVFLQTCGYSSGAADQCDSDAAGQELELDEEFDGEKAEETPPTHAPKVRQSRDNLQYYPDCGVFEMYYDPGRERVAAGINARPGEFPSVMATQQFFKKKGGLYEMKANQCTGVLISPRIVLTSGHCMHPPDSDLELSSVWVKPVHYLAELEGFQDDTWTKVKRFCQSPLYDNNMLYYDLTVLILPEKRAFWLNDTVVPICLPEQSDFAVGPEHQLWLVGIGLTYEGPFTTTPNYPQKLAGRRDLCGPQSFWGDSPGDIIGIWADVHQSFMCLVANQVKGKPCKGDSGGPIIRIQNDRQYLVGVHSAGLDESPCQAERKKTLAFDVQRNRGHIDMLIRECKGDEWSEDLMPIHPPPYWEEPTPPPFTTTTTTKDPELRRRV